MNIQSFKGTLFRFPLRTQAAAGRSEISNVVYDRTRMTQLLSMLVQNAEELLLFTQSVGQVEVYHLPENGMRPQDAVMLLQVTKQVKKILSSQGVGGQAQRILDKAAHLFHGKSLPQKFSMTEVITIDKKLVSKTGLEIQCNVPTGAQDYLLSHWLNR